MGATDDPRLGHAIARLTRLSPELVDLAAELNAIATAPPPGMTPTLRQDVGTVAHECSRLVVDGGSVTKRLRDLVRTRGEQKRTEP